MIQLMNRHNGCLWLCVCICLYTASCSALYYNINNHSSLNQIKNYDSSDLNLSPEEKLQRLENCQNLSFISPIQNKFIPETTRVFKANALLNLSGCMATDTLSDDEYVLAIHQGYSNHVGHYTVKIIAKEFKGRLTLLLESNRKADWKLDLDFLPYNAESKRKHRVFTNINSTVSFVNPADKVKMVIDHIVYPNHVVVKSAKKTMDLVRTRLTNFVVQKLGISCLSNLLYLDQLANHVDYHWRSGRVDDEYFVGGRPASSTPSCHAVTSKYLTSIYDVNVVTHALDAPWTKGCTIPREDEPPDKPIPPRLVTWLEQRVTIEGAIIIQPKVYPPSSGNQSDDNLSILVVADNYTNGKSNHYFVDNVSIMSRIIVLTNVRLETFSKLSANIQLEFEDIKDIGNFIETILAKYDLNNRTQFLVERLITDKKIESNYMIKPQFDAHFTTYNQISKRLLVDCSHSSLEVSFPVWAIDPVLVDKIYMKWDKAEGQCELHKNATHYFRVVQYTAVEFDKCGIFYESLNDKCTYFGKIFLKSPSADIVDSIEFDCCKNASNSRNALKEAVVPENTITLYRNYDFKYATPMENSVFRGWIKQKMYIGINTNGSLMHSCSLTSDLASPVHHIYLIEKGCLTNDSTLVSFHYLMGETRVVSIKRFEFTIVPLLFNIFKDSPFYVQCTFTYCEKNYCFNQAELCAKKDDTVFNGHSYNLSIGPIYIDKPSKKVTKIQPINPPKNSTPRVQQGLTMPYVFIVAFFAFLMGLLVSLSLCIIHRRTKLSLSRRGGGAYTPASNPRRVEGGYVTCFRGPNEQHRGSDLTSPCPAQPMRPCDSNQETRGLGMVRDGVRQLSQNCRCLDCSSGSTPCSQKPLCNSV